MALDRNITPRQKLAAIELKYYQHQIWVPAVGDFYTIVRNDLKLFKITQEENGLFYFLCNEYDSEGTFPVKGFATEDFGPNRVHVPTFIFTVPEWQ